MRDERRILLNTIMLSAGEGFGQLAHFVLIVGFSRKFGAEILGQYSVSMAIGAVAALFVSLGTQPLLVREISRKTESTADLLGVLIPVQMALAVPAWLLACTASTLLIGDTRALPVVAATCGYQVLLRLASLLLTPFQATEQMQVSVTGQLAHRLIAVSLGLSAIWLGAGAGMVALALVLGALALIAYASVRGAIYFGRPALRLAPREAFRLLRLASPFFGLAALGVVYARGSLIMLGALMTQSAVGLYAVVDRLMTAAALAPGTFNSAVYPALSRLAHTSAPDGNVLLVRCLRLVIVGTMPLTAALTLFAGDIIGLVFGTQFLAAASALQVLAWTLPLRGLHWLLGSQLAALDQQSAVARARSFVLCVFLVLTPALILAAGLTGAAWAVVICDGVQLFLFWRLLVLTDSAPALTKSLLAPVLAATATLVTSALLLHLSLPLRALGFCLVMSGSLWTFGAIQRQDLVFLFQIVTSGERSPT
jgi:O-antigen/teichoic acid export membrane protein